MWIILALFSALLAATRRTSEKRLTSSLHHFTLAFLAQALSLPIIGLALLLFGKLLNPLHLGLHFWGPLLITSIGFYPLNAFLYLQAIKHKDLSEVLPIQSLWPVFTLVPAWLTLGEVPSVAAVAGILSTVCGVYALGLKGKAFHHPLKPFIEERGSRFMLLSVILVTIAGILDKIAIHASAAIYYSFASTVGAVLALAVMVILQGKQEVRTARSVIKKVGIVGTLQGGSYTTYLMAIAIGPVAYVSSIRSTNVLMGSLLGIVLLKEPFTPAKRISYGLIAGGSLLLAVGS